jgi:uncharacterized protein (TIGR02996 family)
MKAQKVEEAKVAGATADRQAAVAQEHDDDARLAYADYLEQRKAAQERHDQALQKYIAAGQLVDPRSKMTGGERVKASLYRFFSGLAGPEASKRAMDDLNQRWQNDLALQKARIDQLKDNYVTARTGLQDVEAGRRALKSEAEAFYEARLTMAERQGRAQLAHMGVPKAEIEGDQLILKLKAERAKARAEAAKDADAHALNQARINWMNARAAKAKKAAGGGGGGGGGAAPDADAQLARYAIENQGDIGGLYSLASKLGVPRKDRQKMIGAVVTQTKPTEAQAKDAKQAKVGLNAIEEIERSGYKPTREEIQKWINNQRLTAQAAEHGPKGGLLTLGQWANLVPQSEVEGLSDEAKRYFANVRRYIEPIARSQSGAAISQTEWENFFNQYGPNSSGGMDAARRYLQATGSGSGVAGRSLAAESGKAGAGAAGPPAGSKQGKLSDGSVAYRYPDGTVHRADGSLVK